MDNVLLGLGCEISGKYSDTDMLNTLLIDQAVWSWCGESLGCGGILGKVDLWSIFRYVYISHIYPCYQLELSHMFELAYLVHSLSIDFSLSSPSSLITNQKVVCDNKR